MTVYIEYALLENLLLDGALLYLALKVGRLPVRPWRLFVAALFGGIFALVFPLLSLPPWLALFFKFAVGMLLPLLAMERVKSRREWKKYGLSAALFFLLTFAFGGALFTAVENFDLLNLPLPWVGVGFALLSACALYFAEKLYKRRAILRHVYDCEVFYQDKRKQIRGFYDSGNLATKGGVCVCFLSSDILFDLLGEGFLLSEAQGQVCDEMQINTLTGVRKMSLYKGRIRIKREDEKIEREVYFAPSTNMIAREYKVILHSRIFEEV